MYDVIKWLHTNTTAVCNARQNLVREKIREFFSDGIFSDKNFIVGNKILWGEKILDLFSDWILSRMLSRVSSVHVLDKSMLNFEGGKFLDFFLRLKEILKFCLGHCLGFPVCILF